MLYRFSEAQLGKMAQPFLLDAIDIGGLGLSTIQVGFVYGTVGAVALTLGRILGGFVAAKNGLHYSLCWMVAAINLPNLVYVYLWFVLPDSSFLIPTAVAM